MQQQQREPLVPLAALSPREWDAYSPSVAQLSPTSLASLSWCFDWVSDRLAEPDLSLLTNQDDIMSFFRTLPPTVTSPPVVLAILRLLAHSKTNKYLTKDHLFIQTNPVNLLVHPRTTSKQASSVSVRGGGKTVSEPSGSRLVSGGGSAGSSGSPNSNNPFRVTSAPHQPPISAPPTPSASFIVPQPPPQPQPRSTGPVPPPPKRSTPAPHNSSQSTTTNESNPFRSSPSHTPLPPPITTTAVAPSPPLPPRPAIRRMTSPSSASGPPRLSIISSSRSTTPNTEVQLPVLAPKPAKLMNRNVHIGPSSNLLPDQSGGGSSGRMVRSNSGSSSLAGGINGASGGAQHVFGSTTTLSTLLGKKGAGGSSTTSPSKSGQNHKDQQISLPPSSSESSDLSTSSSDSGLDSGAKTEPIPSTSTFTKLMSTSNSSLGRSKTLGSKPSPPPPPPKRRPDSIYSTASSTTLINPSFSPSALSNPFEPPRPTPTPFSTSSSHKRSPSTRTVSSNIEATARTLLEKGGTKSEEWIAGIGRKVSAGAGGISGGRVKREEKERLVGRGGGGEEEEGEGEIGGMGGEEEEEDEEDMRRLREKIRREQKGREEGWRPLD